MWLFGFVFFFQAEDGIRDGTVTGVQTCALPISPPPLALRAVCGPQPKCPYRSDDNRIQPRKCKFIDGHIRSSAEQQRRPEEQWNEHQAHKNDQQFSAGQKEYEGWPRHIKLLFQSQRPCWRQESRTVQVRKQILEVQNVIKPCRIFAVIPGSLAKSENDDENNEKRREIQRPDAQRAASVEVAKVVRGSLRIQQYSGNQKTRKHKEQVNPRAPVLQESKVRYGLQILCMSE